MAEKVDVLQSTDHEFKVLLDNLSAMKKAMDIRDSTSFSLGDQQGLGEIEFIPERPHEGEVRRIERIEALVDKLKSNYPDRNETIVRQFPVDRGAAEEVFKDIQFLLEAAAKKPTGGFDEEKKEMKRNFDLARKDVVSAATEIMTNLRASAGDLEILSERLGAALGMVAEVPSANAGRAEVKGVGAVKGKVI